MQIEVKILEVICGVILHLAALLQLREDAIVAFSTSAALDSTVWGFVLCLFYVFFTFLSQQ